EDGIRDFHVTGVQTCALPISRTASRPASPWALCSFPSSSWSPAGVKRCTGSSTSSRPSLSCGSSSSDRAPAAHAGRSRKKQPGADGARSGLLPSAGSCGRSVEVEERQGPADRVHRAEKRLALLVREVDLDHLFHAARAEDDGHAGADVADAVLAFQVGDGGQNPLLVLE